MAVAALVAHLALLPAPVQAGPAAEAEAEIQKGIALRRKNKEFEALPHFQRAHALAPTPRTAAQLALCEQGLGRWLDAESHFEQALEAEADPWIKSNRAVLEDSLRKVQGHISLIELTGEPAGAQVIVNGKPAGTLPLPRPLRVGEGFVELEVRADGHSPEKRKLDMKGAQPQQMFVRLERIGRPTVVADLPRSAPKEEPPQPTGAGPTNPPPPDEEGPSTAQIMKVSGVVLAVGGLVAAGYGLRQTLRVNELNDQMIPPEDPRAKEGKRADRNQWIGYGIGAACLVAGGALFWLGSSTGGAAEDAVAIGVGPAAFGTGVAIRGRY